MYWKTLPVLFVITVGYLFIGAAVFQSLESDNEQDTKEMSRGLVRNFLANKTCISDGELEVLIKSILEAYDQGVMVSNQTASNDNWDFWNSLFFSATVVTTIGYGHISPSTEGGRIFCIFYAIIGIPLIGVFLATIGLTLSSPLKKFRKRSKAKWKRVLKTITISVLGCCILVLLPGLGFHRAENWSFFESIYYAVITLTTIGFGDYVVGQTKESYAIWYKMITMVWIFVGLAWFAVILSDIGDYFTTKVKEKEASVRRRKPQEVDTIRSRKSSRINGQYNSSFSQI